MTTTSPNGAISVTVRGLKEFDSFMAELPEAMQRKWLYSALYAAGLPVIRNAQTNVRNLFGSSERYTGTLERGIGRGRTKRTQYAAQVNVKLNKPKSPGPQTINGVRKRWGDDPFYGRYLESGTKSGVRAYHWLERAAATAQRSSSARMYQVLQDKMKKYCRDNGVKFVPGGGS